MKKPTEIGRLPTAYYTAGYMGGIGLEPTTPKRVEQKWQ
jgi:hypothetical protein